MLMPILEQQVEEAFRKPNHPSFPELKSILGCGIISAKTGKVLVHQGWKPQEERCGISEYAA